MPAAASIELRELAADLAYASGEGIDRAAKDLIADVAGQVQAQAAAHAPRRTGALARSITIHWLGPLSVVVEPAVGYGVYQEFGTGSHGEFGGSAYEIRPKKAGGYLRFQVGSQVVFARRVMHPGVRPQPFMRPAAVAAAGPFADELARRGQLLITQGPRYIA